MIPCTVIGCMCHIEENNSEGSINQHGRDRRREGGVLSDVCRRIFNLTEHTWLCGLLENTQVNGVKVQSGLASSNVTLYSQQIRRSPVMSRSVSTSSLGKPHNRCD